jgi:ribosomal-protein-alanine N-acetyltransferase
MQENRKVKLRPILWQSDLPRLIMIERAGFAMPWDAKKFFDFSFKACAAGVVAVDLESGEVVAFMLYEVRPAESGDAFHISHIAVHPRHQSRGIGRTMLMSLCRDDTVVTLNARKSNVRAQDLYLRMGFGIVESRSGHYPDGEDAVVMRYLEGECHVCV